MHAPIPSNLTISGLHKSFGKSEVLCWINQTFASGLTAILGPNGAGKTTLIRCAIGLKKADAGTVELCRGDPTYPKSRQRLGVMVQDGDLPDLLPPHEMSRPSQTSDMANYSEGRNAVSNLHWRLSVTQKSCFWKNQRPGSISMPSLRFGRWFGNSQGKAEQLF